MNQRNLQCDVSIGNILEAGTSISKFGVSILYIVLKQGRKKVWFFQQFSYQDQIVREKGKTR